MSCMTCELSDELGVKLCDVYAHYVIDCHCGKPPFKLIVSSLVNRMWETENRNVQYGIFISLSLFPLLIHKYLILIRQTLDNVQTLHMGNIFPSMNHNHKELCNTMRGQFSTLLLDFQK